MIIEALRVIHAKHRLTNVCVSKHTKSAQIITKEWQQCVCTENIKAEVKVSPLGNEKIDIVDFSKNEAYELKVSGKNTHHEFYKDLVKVLTYNEYVGLDNKLHKLIFISEMSLFMLKNIHELSVELVSI